MRHHHESVASARELIHHPPLGCIGFAQNSVQSRDHRHTDLFEQREEMTPRRSAVNAKLVLHTEDPDVVEVQKVCRAPVRVDVLF